MKKVIASFIVAVISLFGFVGPASAEPENYVVAGFDLGTGITNWVATAGAGGYGNMNFGEIGKNLVNSYASNNYGTASVYANPWASGSVSSGEGGVAQVSSKFVGNAMGGLSFSSESGISTFSSMSKSISLSASSSGNGSASVNGGFDVFVGTNGFVLPAFAMPPSFPSVKDGM